MSLLHQLVRIAGQGQGHHGPATVTAMNHGQCGYDYTSSPLRWSRIIRRLGHSKIIRELLEPR